MTHPDPVVAELVREVAALRAEAEARRLLARYMFLCDSPLPEPGMDDEQRARAIGELFTDDAVWEGVGATQNQAFGKHLGGDAVAAHMLRFYTAENPKQVFNTHYLTAEQLRATPDGAEGNWVQFQPWMYDDGTSQLRSSRLHVRFRPTDAGWRICGYRTENLFVAPLPDHWWGTRIEQSVLMAGQPAR